MKMTCTAQGGSVPDAAICGIVVTAQEAQGALQHGLLRVAGNGLTLADDTERRMD